MASNNLVDALQIPAGDEEFEERCDQIERILRTDFNFWNIRRSVKDELFSDSKAEISDMEAAIMQALSRNGELTQLTNMIVRIQNQTQRNRAPVQATRSRTPTAKSGKIPAFPAHLRHLEQPEEPLEVVEAARREWDTRIRLQVRALADQQRRPLCKVRETMLNLEKRMSNSSPRSEGMSSMSGADSDGEADREEKEKVESPRNQSVYSISDLFQVVTSITNPNFAGVAARVWCWGLIKLELKTPDIRVLREKYSELQPENRQIGLDDLVLGNEWYVEERQSVGEKLSASDNTLLMSQYAKCGIPPSLRPVMWSKIMGVQASPKNYTYFESLLNQVQWWDMITDDFYRMDVQETGDDEQYFVFEEMMEELMLAFSRDPWFMKNCSLTPSLAPLSTSLPASAVGTPTEPPAHVPACGIMPFRHQVMYAAPLTYLFSKAEDAYFLFRQLYARFFIRLHTISSRSNSLISLCKLYENLIQYRVPEAFYHAMELGIHPLKVAFPWIVCAFSGYFTVDQVLHLWDRLIGYDSLELIAVLAAAVFSFRSKSILRCHTPQEFQDLFSDLSNLKVVPLLQSFLFC